MSSRKNRNLQKNSTPQTGKNSAPKGADVVTEKRGETPPIVHVDESPFVPDAVVDGDSGNTDSTIDTPADVQDEKEVLIDKPTGDEHPADEAVEEAVNDAPEVVETSEVEESAVEEPATEKPEPTEPEEPPVVEQKEPEPEEPVAPEVKQPDPAVAITAEVEAEPYVSRHLRKFMEYTDEMVPNRPQNEQTIYNSQMKLLTSLEAIIKDPEIRQGASDLNKVLDVIAKTEQGTFGDNYIYRGARQMAVALGDDKFELLIGVLKIIAAPRRTGQAIKIQPQDLCARLPSDISDPMLRKLNVIASGI